MTTADRCLVPVYDRIPLVVESGEGCYVFDASGKRYLDAITGVGVNALGHAHPRILAAIADQCRRCIHTSNLVHHPYQGRLAERLCAMSGMDRAFFSNSGAEAMEAALKAIWGHGRTTNPNKTRLVALHNSFHGRTLGSLAVTAGVIVEPVLGEGRLIPLQDKFLQLAREVSAQAGALLVADEIQCGLGRTGCYFAYQWAGIRPDIVVIAKPLAGGLPMGATLFTHRAASTLTCGMHGSTFGGGPLACRVALEFLDVLDDLLPQIQDIGQYLFHALCGLRDKHACIEDVRGKGLMTGIQLSIPGRPVVEAALERGLLLNCTHGTVLRLLPPYILSRQQADEMVHILDRSLYAEE